MQYFLLILVIPIGWYVYNIFVYPKKKEKKEVNEPTPTYTKQQHDFFAGRKQPSIDYHGKLIDMDEHSMDIWEEKN